MASAGITLVRGFGRLTGAKQVTVTGSDPHGLDADGDGVACGGDWNSIEFRPVADLNSS